MGVRARARSWIVLGWTAILQHGPLFPDVVLLQLTVLAIFGPRGLKGILRLTPECFRLCFYPSVGVFGRSTIVALNGGYDRSFGGVYTDDG